MYNLLIISSIEGDSYKALDEQINYLEKFGVKVTLLIDPSELDFVNLIENCNYDCAYIHVKSRTISNGRLFDAARLLEYYHIPYLGNDSITQMLIADKQLVSYRSGIGLSNVIITRTMWENQLLPKGIENIDYPIIVKPNNFHASQGISKNSVVKDSNELFDRISLLFKRYLNLNEILLEKYIDNSTEYTVSVLGNEGAFACSVTKLNYKDKSLTNLYTEKDKLSQLEERSFDFEIESNQNIIDRLTNLSKSLFVHFNMKDIARFDYIVNKSVYLLEANSCPVPGNSFTWEWQLKCGLKKHQTIALFLCAFHFAQISSFRCDNLPLSLILDLPTEIINKISCPNCINTKPECTESTSNCKKPQLYKMNSRVGSEIEVLEFLESITKLLKPRVILETGTFDGNGTIAFAEGVTKNGFGKVISLEFDSNLSQKAKKNLSQYPVEIINTNSLSYTPKDKIDLLFLDSKRTIRKEEFIRFRPYLHKSSIILWHDSAYREKNHAVFDDIEELYSYGTIDRILLPTPRGITISKLRT